jgi:hypothetical protein
MTGPSAVVRQHKPVGRNRHEAGYANLLEAPSHYAGSISLLDGLVSLRVCCRGFVLSYYVRGTRHEAGTLIEAHSHCAGSVSLLEVPRLITGLLWVSVVILHKRD